MVSYDHTSLGLRAQLAGHSWADLQLWGQQAPSVLKSAMCHAMLHGTLSCLAWLC